VDLFTVKSKSLAFELSPLNTSHCCVGFNWA
jgi:hypothetical protein